MNDHNDHSRALNIPPFHSPISSPTPNFFILRLVSLHVGGK